MKHSKHEVPFGLPRIVAMSAYFIVICITGMAVQACDPLQEMMKLSGAFSHFQFEADRNAAIASVVGFGISFAVLSGAFVGVTIDIIGAKITALMGLALHALAYTLLFFTELPVMYYISGCLFGLAYQFIKISHLSSATFFPKLSNIIISLFSAAIDLSLFIPYAILLFARHYGGGSAGVRKAVLQYLLIFVSAAVLIDLFLLPIKPFGSKKPNKEPEKVALIEGDEEAAAVSATKGKPPKEKSYWRILCRQLGTPDIWLFLIYVIFAFCRKKHFSVLIRPILMELDSDPDKADAMFYVDLFNQTVPFGFIAAIIWGAFVDLFGVNACLIASNTLGIAFCATAVVKWMPLQLLTIGIFIVYQCFIMGQVLAFITMVYGFRTVATLQGICCSIIGVFSFMMDIFWAPFITETLGSYRASNMLWIVIGCILYIIPVALIILDKRRKRLQGEDLIEPKEEGLFETFLPNMDSLDRKSLGLLEDSISLHSRASLLNL